MYEDNATYCIFKQGQSQLIYSESTYRCYFFIQQIGTRRSICTWYYDKYWPAGGKHHGHSLHPRGLSSCGWVCVSGTMKSDGDAFLPSWESLWASQCSLPFLLSAQPALLLSPPTPSEDRSLWVCLASLNFPLGRINAASNHRGTALDLMKQERCPYPTTFSPRLNASMKVVNKQENSPHSDCDLLSLKPDWPVSYANKASLLCLGQVLFVEQLTKSWGSGPSWSSPRPQIILNMSVHSTGLSRSVCHLFLCLSVCLFVFSPNL